MVDAAAPLDAEIQTVDLDVFRSEPGSERAKDECRRAAESLILTGALIVRDSRATETTNSTFLSLLEDYFAQPLPVLADDERPELGYQVGATLPNTEKPSCKSNESCLAVIEGLEPDQRPLDILGHGADPKSRFFWRMGDEGQRVSEDGRASSEVENNGDVKPQVALGLDQDAAAPKKPTFLDAPNVVPAAFADVWEGKMDDWGSRMRDAVTGVAEMAAVGLGLEKDVFREAAKGGPHLLAPTATDLDEYGKLDTIFAGFHTDLNFLTIHGKSRYPGLHIWARNSGRRVAVKVPDGCLLVQAGKQIEWMTGGLVKAGYHEVVCTQGTLDAVERMKRDHPDRPRIRISSTFFYHLNSKHMLQPIPALAKTAVERFGPQKEYGKMTVGDQVRRELGMIALMTDGQTSDEKASLQPADDKSVDLEDDDDQWTDAVEQQQREHADDDNANKLPLEDLRSLLADATAQKTKGNELYSSSSHAAALTAYEAALDLLPEFSPPPSGDAVEELTDEQAEPEVMERRQVEIEAMQLKKAVWANIGAVRVKMGEDKKAVEACSEALKIDAKYVKALQRRAAANDRIASWSALTAAQDDYILLLTLLPSTSPELPRIRRALSDLPARIATQQKAETDEMLGKLRELGDGLLGKIGLSTSMFKFDQQEGGGYSMRFER